MPLYEYKCDRCGDVFEVIQKFSDTPLEQHEGCGGHVERLVSAAALQFKGTGWYVTDYARSGGGKTSSKNDGKSEGKSESKDTGANGSGKESSKTESSKPAPASSASSDKK